jgi:3-deoxy-7-phosphoheptulonate synthase
MDAMNKCLRETKSGDTVVEIGKNGVGGFPKKPFCVIAGPCSVENEDQIMSTAESIAQIGATVSADFKVNFMLRGGAFKPRTSPYAFQGLHEEGIKLLVKAKNATGLPIVSEIMDINHLEIFTDVDIIQVGARNMQNFELLKELGHSDKPILLKRGLANTIDELLMSAEYIMSGGNENVIFCERGIRTFETQTRNTLDISAVALLKKLSHLPVVVDPSHAAGRKDLILPLSKAAIAAGADGLEIEVHNCPEKALSDKDQQLTPEEFSEIMGKMTPLIKFMTL